MLVSEDGQRVFYAERDPLPDKPTEFVKRVVYPLLDRGVGVMTDVAMTRALRVFLASVPKPYILADHPNDLKLVALVLAGFNLPDDQLHGCGSTPRPVMTLMLREGLMTMLLEDWFSARPEEAAEAASRLGGCASLAYGMARLHRPYRSFLVAERCDTQTPMTN